MSTTTEILPSAHFIGGEWSQASSGAVTGSIDPATEEVHAELAAGDATDVDRAVAAARESFDQGTWRSMPPAKRAKVLWKLAELIDRNREAIALAETMDTGKTAFDSGRIEVPLLLAEGIADEIDAPIALVEVHPTHERLEMSLVWLGDARP